MKAHYAIRFAIAIAATFAAAVTSAQGPGGPGGPGFGMHRPPMERAMRAHNEFGRWWNNPKIVEKLKLTEDQRKAMDDILLKHREKLVDLRANLQKVEIQLEPLVKADQPNEPAVMSQIDKVAQARAELEKANSRFLFALRAKLTPDQWKQVQDLRQNPDGMRRNWRDGRGPGNGPCNFENNGAPPPPPGPQGMLGPGPSEENSSSAANQ